MDTPTPTVIVIDDSPSVHLFFERCVEPLGVQLKAFTSAAESLAHLQHGHPALVFLDIIMPDKDGLTFLQEMRGIPGLEQTPVIVISSKDYAQDRTTAKTLGAVDFVAKPMSTKTIRDLIVKYTGVQRTGGDGPANG